MVLVSTSSSQFWRAFFLPAFWLATSSGRLFPPDVGREPAGAPAAMILKNRDDPTTNLSATFRLLSLCGCGKL